MPLAVFFLLLGLLAAEVGLVGPDWVLLVGAGSLFLCAVTLATLRPRQRRAKTELDALRRVHDHLREPVRP